MTNPKFDREYFVAKGRKGGQTFKEWFAALTQEEKDAFLAPAREAYKRKMAAKKLGITSPIDEHPEGV